jgi:SAM-dependent methyltransferase
MDVPRWTRPTHYAGREFRYRRCMSCGSLACDPMPDDEVLGLMYGPTYAGEDGSATQNAYDDWVLRVLATLPSGTFLDYGCGQGRLLRRVADSGRRVVGVEYDADVVRRTSGETGLPIHTPNDVLPGSAGIVHLGDVLEHLTDVETQLEEVLSLLRPGGVVLAQGPLDAAPNLFSWMVRVGVMARPGPTHIPPYHVLLATAAGQQALFARHRLTTLSFETDEDAWPAPPTRPARGVRPTMLWGLRKASQVASRGAGNRWGNRYRYVGCR